MNKLGFFVNKKTIILLMLILLVGAILRLYGLKDFPSGLNADEAAIGYNAYSLLKTGHDEYGQSFPLAFKSFGDFKPGLYFYFAMPFIAVFGLSELAVRLPSAILGIATIYITFLIGRALFKKTGAGLTSAFILAISPWHIHFSRGGWESNSANFFIALGVYFFVRSLEKFRFFLFSLICFCISMYLYQSPRLVVPVMLLLLVIFYKNLVKKNLKSTIKYTVIVFIIAIPLIMQFVSGGGSARFSGLSFLSDMGPINRTNELRGEHSNPNSVEPKLLHNKLTYLIPTFLDHYLDHFSSQFLFIRGEEVIRNKVPEVGQFYMINSLLLVIGVVMLAIKKLNNIKVLMIWLLVSPLASAMTFQTPSALRSVMMVIPFSLLMGYGLWWIFNIKMQRIKIVLISAIFVVLSFEFVHYLESYYIHYPKRTPIAWEYGFEEMTKKLLIHQSQFDKVIITDRYDQPYILVLFYSRYDPLKYQPQAKLTERDKFNFSTVSSFDKYEFRRIKEEDLKQGILLVGTKEEIPIKANVIDKVNFPNGESAFVFAKL